jgi:hypothetical protein
MRMLFSITTAAPLLAGCAVALWVASPATRIGLPKAVAPSESRDSPTYKTIAG